MSSSEDVLLTGTDEYDGTPSHSKAHEEVMFAFGL